MKTIDELLESWFVDSAWDNDQGPRGWFAVGNDDGIVAYFGSERDAYRYRLDAINRELNG